MNTPGLAGASDAASADTGVEGNSRITATTGMLLLLMLAVEGVTVLDVRGMITLHVFLGVMLLGPVVLKVATTLYRFARYYRGAEAYVRRGAPHIVLRVLGPFVTLTSLALLGTGVGLLAAKPGDGLLLTAHKASFVVWFGVMAVHVFGHLREALLASWRELRQASGRQRARLAIVALALIAGVGAAAILTPAASAWTNRPSGVGDHR
jgi:hypothetical protein